VLDETGLALDVIGSREEAELALSGCAALLDGLVPRGILFDIGGGSTEVLLVEHTAGTWRAVDYVSIPRGVVGYAEQLGNVVSADEYERMVREIQDMLGPFERRNGLAAQVRAGTLQMVGASGTVTTLAGVHMRLPRYNRAVVDGSWLDFENMRTASGRIVALDWHERADHPCIGPERADLVVPGCAILEAICRIWPVGRLRVADRGLREGIILGLMRTAAPLPGAAQPVTSQAETPQPETPQAETLPQAPLPATI
jgi:exopolyphosphatase/guanosine-5'-triphosphate,3'-diphosphate pyrophosphatase